MTKYSNKNDSLDKKEELMPAPNLMGGVYKRGIICPFNQDDKGPAKRRIQCLIWADYAQYWHYGEDAQRFCRSTCHYGKNYADQRTMRERARNSFLAQKSQLQTFQNKYYANLLQWWQKPNWMKRHL